MRGRDAKPRAIAEQILARLDALDVLLRDALPVLRRFARDHDLHAEIEADRAGSLAKATREAARLRSCGLLPPITTDHQRRRVPINGARPKPQHRRRPA